MSSLAITINLDIPECAICLDDVEDNSLKTKCNHLFHKGCIQDWIKKHNNCPMCRAENPLEKKEIAPLEVIENKTVEVNNTASKISKFLIAGFVAFLMLALAFLFLI